MISGLLYVRLHRSVLLLVYGSHQGFEELVCLHAQPHTTCCLNTPAKPWIRTAHFWIFTFYVPHPAMCNWLCILQRDGGRPLALIRLGNVAAQLALRAQPRRKEQGPPHPRPYGKGKGIAPQECRARDLEKEHGHAGALYPRC